ncbi:hypothetical protein V1478_007434 [Vespula squamosa]|uniref:Uncharacterized protein n=1 Tax=Vespula squamosa TaxID=30214 RepID=A0ABD2B399_VESSQ
MDQEQHASTGSRSTILVLDDCSPTRAIMTMVIMATVIDRVYSEMILTQNDIVKLSTSSVDTLKTDAQYLAL